ncbi:PTS acetylgalactosamine transporter subunit IIC [Marinithermofilum abyssi]|jgi:N-acetylgalactosamine PTS system EIIC component|uniref:PTS acetylgalactosamine transporter subunit IIC n=1 Tax=Marinithermofilum abyssi TaxID=1571185 RepID=A0A8J2VGE6_9BACL|nr:PTS N-acetylgalactosamine transporter subunit IIC [Marinithermofilum abyssi]GGE16117.1 PTS acetylgalactosamine transporter subunit IIC [Marinithermofilum abyssi]
MLTEALLIALWAGIAGIDQFNGLTHLHRPIVTGMVVGLILGDFQTGLIAGATLELVWMGMVPLAGAQPPNVVIGGVMGTAFAILLDQDPKVAVSIAVPFAVAVQGAITLLFTVYSPVMHKMDRYAEKANDRATDWLNLSGMGVLFIFNIIIAFLPIYFGVETAKSLVDSLPSWLMNGLSVAGGIMPAIGFAMLLTVMLKKQYVAFLLAGFAIVTYSNISLLGLAILALAFALYDYYKGETSSLKEEKASGI